MVRGPRRPVGDRRRRGHDHDARERGRAGACLGIAVLNISPRHRVFPSYAEDPLAQAVQGLMDGGVVVVASAGSYGKPKIHGVEVPVYGGIASPGNLPDVITVVALNTRATVDRGDDNTATCGSNGPAAAELGP